MNLDTSKVEFSKYDIAHDIVIPRNLTKNLAYFSGIHFGDGNMGNYKKYYYSLEYSGHLIDEYEFYTVYFKKIFNELFNKELRVYKKFRSTGDYLSLCTQSKGIFTFLRNSLGLPVGNKAKYSLPNVVVNSSMTKYFIKGFADSDFCLSFKVGSKSLNNYSVISVNSNNRLAME